MSYPQLSENIHMTPTTLLICDPTRLALTRPPCSLLCPRAYSTMCGGNAADMEMFQWLRVRRVLTEETKAYGLEENTAGYHRWIQSLAEQPVTAQDKSCRPGQLHRHTHA